MAFPSSLKQNFSLMLLGESPCTIKPCFVEFNLCYLRSFFSQMIQSQQDKGWGLSLRLHRDLQSKTSYYYFKATNFVWVKHSSTMWKFKIQMQMDRDVFFCEVGVKLGELSAAKHVTY